MKPQPQLADTLEDKLRVLVVDDDLGMRNSIRRVLKIDGFQVDTAESGRELLARADLSIFFAILLDRKLPDGDASGLITELRTRAPNASVLIITGHVDIDSTLAAIRHGVDDYLIKPIEPEALRTRLKSLAELYRVRQELRLSESRMRFLVENLPAGAVYVDHHNLFFNRAVQELTGYQAADIGTVHDWFKVLCCDHFAECLEKYETVQKAGFPEACVMPIIRKDGVRRELKIAGHRYDHHEVWLVTDNTELLDAQRKLVQAERLAAIGQMVTGLAHESRNALQRARGCLDLLELDLEGQSEQLDLIFRIRRSLGDLQRNYEEVRQYAAPINLRRDNVLLADLVSSAFENVLCEHPGEKHRLILDQPDETSITCDAHRMTQVFRNVIENSVAARSSGATIHVSITDHSDQGNSLRRIELSDNGSGMTQETATRIFEPFFTTKQSGTGLGMPICQRIIDAHAARIQVTSVKDKGTKVTIDMPK